MILLGILALANAAQANELTTLESRKDLTPEKLLRYVSHFSFELGDKVQDPETFLRRRRGDCDDFARLASVVLDEHGYHTKLVVIMMAEQTHVVCYVKEAGGFLDFNHRADPHPIVKSDGSLEDIAEKTAAYFRNPWRLVSEFRYQGNVPVFAEVVFPKASEPQQFTVSETEPASAKSDRPDVVALAGTESHAAKRTVPIVSAPLKPDP